MDTKLKTTIPTNRFKIQCHVSCSCVIWGYISRQLVSSNASYFKDHNVRFPFFLQWILVVLTRHIIQLRNGGLFIIRALEP